MLKIKDNIDLTELEKFGFHNYSYAPHLYQKTIVERDYALFKIFIYIENRMITITPLFEDELHQLDTVFDLIQAGLVEKVED